ncbi:hypothetical protein POM88_001106 [Heracleum sosnowskyi]|uniref:Uncharacterized protein n=1 Tax=Heracleum sosnowskyi TaxID=360622 RepID=A0AAD8JF71_9APIA|nr:hypothetical protein POM88_001106 [Heracleum sosnowskyi]
MSLKLKNFALLAKWWWRSYRERDALWNIILSQRFGKVFHYALNEVNWSHDGSPIVRSFVDVKKYYEGKQIDKIWRIVVATTTWSILLARNEALFQNRRLGRELLEFVILTRIDKWGKASGVIKFGNDPFWKVNPHGAIALYTHKISRDYWKYKFVSYNLCSVNTEIEAFLHVISLISVGEFANKRIVICSDSVNALEQIRIELPYYYPIQGRIPNIKSILGWTTFLHYVPRNLNLEVDSLAKSGLNRKAMAFFWASAGL